MALLEMFRYFTLNSPRHAARSRPTIWRPRSPMPPWTASRCPTSTRCPTTTRSSPPPARHQQRGHLRRHAGTAGEPDQLARLQNDMSLLPLAVEEMVRWTTPVRSSCAPRSRTTRSGVRIAGESVLLSYVSGNRDEDIFDEPFRFDVGRDPNKHIAFGYGALLPRCGAGPDGDQQLRRTAAAIGARSGTRGCAGTHGHHVRRRPLAPPMRYSVS